MAYCSKCGSYIPDDSAVCPGCGNVIQKVEAEKKSYADTITQQVEQRNTGASYRDAPIDNGMPMLAEGEELVKTYLAAKLKRPKGTGYLSVTNKRVIFHGKTNGSAINKEVMLDSVSGMDCFVGTNYNIPLIIIGAIMAFVGLRIFFSTFDRGGISSFIVGLTLTALAAWLIYSSVRRNCTVKIYSSKVTGSPIEFGGGPMSLIGNHAVLLLVCESTDDTKTMMRELGALICDLQTMGDRAISKWKK